MSNVASTLLLVDGPGLSQTIIHCMQCQSPAINSGVPIIITVWLYGPLLLTLTFSAAKGYPSWHTVQELTVFRSSQLITDRWPVILFLYHLALLRISLPPAPYHRCHNDRHHSSSTATKYTPNSLARFQLNTYKITIKILTSAGCQVTLCYFIWHVSFP